MGGRRSTGIGFERGRQAISFSGTSSGRPTDKRRRKLPWLLLLAACGGTLWWYWRGNVCGLPLEYRIGGMDERFGLSESEMLSAIGEAERWWETNAGHDLFRHNPRAKIALTFNAVYDERQQATQEMQKIEEERSAVSGDLAALRDEYGELKSEYDRREAVLAEMNGVYEERLAQFESSVRFWNSRGGAPPDIYESLQRERQKIDDYAGRINALIAEQNELAARINRLADKESEVVSGFNEGVRQFNETFAAAEGTEEEQGIYGSGTINVYQFDDRRDLVLLLAHEMGHALGLDHSNDPLDIMYAKKNERQATGEVRISADSLRELEERCNLK